jgi:hypothetical protein
MHNISKYIKYPLSFLLTIFRTYIKFKINLFHYQKINLLDIRLMIYLLY